MTAPINFGWHGGMPNFFLAAVAQHILAGGSSRIQQLRGLTLLNKGGFIFKHSFRMFAKTGMSKKEDVIQKTAFVHVLMLRSKCQKRSTLSHCFHSHFVNIDNEEAENTDVSECRQADGVKFTGLIA